MPERTPQDFVDEAKQNDPYIVVGRNQKKIRPRSRHHFTHDELTEQTRVNLAWQRWFADNPMEEPPTDPEDPRYVRRPFDWDLDARFGADRDAFWAVWGKAPQHTLYALLRELDDYYDPTPASDTEKADADDDPAGETAGKSRSAATS